jgi:acetolactate synthase I/III small subunit
MRHTLIALVQDHPGVLNRVVSLFRRRGYNIESLAVGASETPGLSRMTIAVDVRDVDQVVKQFSRLIEVLTVRSVTNDRTVVRETALVKVVTPEGRRQELAALAAGAGARVLDACDATVLLEITDAPDEVSAFVARARECGAVELTRSGRIAMALGATSLLAVPAPYSWQADGATDDAAA